MAGDTKDRRCKLDVETVTVDGRETYMRTAYAQKHDELNRRARWLIAQLRWSLEDVERVFDTGSPRDGITTKEGLNDSTLRDIVDRLEGAWRGWLDEHDIDTANRHRFFEALSAACVRAEPSDDAPLDPEQQARAFELHYTRFAELPASYGPELLARALAVWRDGTGSRNMAPICREFGLAGIGGPSIANAWTDHKKKAGSIIFQND